MGITSWLCGKDSESSKKEIDEPPTREREDMSAARHYFERTWATVTLDDGEKEDIVYDSRSQQGDLIQFIEFTETCFSPKYRSYEGRSRMELNVPESHKLFYSPQNIENIDPYTSEEMVACAKIPTTVEEVYDEDFEMWSKVGTSVSNSEFSDVVIEPAE